MQEKDLKILLQEYGFEETSSAFNDVVMQQINILSKQTKPLLNTFVLKLLKIIFILVVISLVICAAFFPPNLPSISFVDISSNVYKQMFSFVIVFWVMMFINVWWNSRKRTLKIIS
ncbi:MAG TPA: hypothetical protein VGI61_12255 [Parafilimonas sp.]